MVVVQKFSGSRLFQIEMNPNRTSGICSMHDLGVSAQVRISLVQNGVQQICDTIFSIPQAP